MIPKGAKGAPKVSPKATTIPQKIATSKKVEKGGSPALSFGLNFDLFLVKNASKSRCEKLCRKTRQQNMKIKQKTEHDPTPKNEDSQISSAKAVPPK